MSRPRKKNYGLIIRGHVDLVRTKFVRGLIIVSPTKVLQTFSTTTLITVTLRLE